LVKDFLVKNNVTTLELLHYSPDPAPPDFYLSPRLKSALKRRHFFVMLLTVKNATEELKRLSQNGFEECQKHL
jgi:hypothetical protein